MPRPDDLYVAQCVLAEGTVPREKLIECIWDLEKRRQSGGGRNLPLGTVLVSNSLLKDADIRRILEQKASGEPPDAAAPPPPAPIPVAPPPPAAAPAPPVKSYLACPKCKKRYSLAKVEPGRVYRCPACGGPLAPSAGPATGGSSALLRAVNPAGAGSPASGGSSAGLRAVRPPGAAPLAAGAGGARPGGVRPGKRSLNEMMAERRAAREKAQTAASAAAAGPPVDPADIDQASGLYLKQKGLVRPELIREADRMQREFAAYGLSQPLLTVFRQIDAVSWQTAKQLEQIDIASVVRSEAWKQQAVPGYVITGKIAAGGFATVFAAKPLFAEGRLALKILRANATPSALVQFRHEAELLSQFEHPNIVKVRDYGALPSNLHYMAMDFIDGSAVDFLLSKKGPFAPEVVLQITRQTAEALQYLQREGYIHRDVKPENILIDRKGNAHLCDFGFAQLIQETAPAGVGDTTVGTAAYMSPEQARGELDIKVGTDIYALGLTCYAMMTGKPPFQGENTGQIMAERFAGGVAAPDLAPLAACPPLQSVIGRMLDPERVKRYRNYEELLEALEAVRL